MASPSQKPFYQLFCPRCKKPIEWKDNPFRPFCSDRCKQIDLGQWATESYRIEGRPVDEEDEVKSAEQPDEE